MLIIFGSLSLCFPSNLCLLPLIFLVDDPILHLVSLIRSENRQTLPLIYLFALASQ